MDSYPEYFFAIDDEKSLEELKTPQFFSTSNPIDYLSLLNQPEQQIINTSELFTTDPVKDDSVDDVSDVVGKDDFASIMSMYPIDFLDDILPPPARPRSSLEEIPVVRTMEPKKAAEWMIEDRVSHKRRRPYLHEYFRLLLDKPHYLDLASYININEGIFKLHKPHEIAALWGNVKGRNTVHNMTYDKMARALRLYYKSGIMTSVKGRYTFQFGPQSGFNTLWKPKFDAHKSLKYSINQSYRKS
ncbi:unnamed protein product [Didymodactylos carnosus]|uniref:ETS domain-containing protein n=1 Tax=Didymodactylos carnosus TaxID=1234261 RepID=A0A815CF05_9BILA|nr:unnamed protein product [Didymodactylos carnosus]CAF1387476.1 unnamed protein product [Didymodactylos carnosus]CAF4079472.1 unnamed protein product [Didymodactylos carnosus]CAF4195230.1 unnamed protein product [Didymodactylos carnosus]